MQGCSPAMVCEPSPPLWPSWPDARLAVKQQPQIQFITNRSITCISPARSEIALHINATVRRVRPCSFIFVLIVADLTWIIRCLSVAK